MLDHLVGLVRVRVLRGVNLAIRDLRSSDPYVVVRIGKQVRPTLLFLLPALLPCSFPRQVSGIPSDSPVDFAWPRDLSNFAPVNPQPPQRRGRLNCQLLEFIFPD